MNYLPLGIIIGAFIAPLWLWVGSLVLYGTDRTGFSMRLFTGMKEMYYLLLWPLTAKNNRDLTADRTGFHRPAKDLGKIFNKAMSKPFISNDEKYIANYAESIRKDFVEGKEVSNPVDALAKLKEML